MLGRATRTARQISTGISISLATSSINTRSEIGMGVEGGLQHSKDSDLPLWYISYQVLSLDPYLENVFHLKSF